MAKRGLHTQFSTSAEDASIITKCTTEDLWGEKLMESAQYSWIRSTIKNYRGKEDAGEVNPIVETQLWRQHIGSWEETTSQALDSVEHTVESVNAALFEKACPDRNLRLRLQAWLQDDFQKAAKDARDELARLMLNERGGQLFTLHPSITIEKQKRREALIQAILAECILLKPERALPQTSDTPVKVGYIPTNMLIQSLLDSSAELAGILNTHDSLAVYYEVALYRFIDNFAL